MTRKIRQLIVLATLFAIPFMGGCVALPAGNVVQAATVVHTSGARKHTAAVQVPVPAPEVFAAIVRLLEERPDNIIENRNDRAFLIEIEEGGRSMTGQVTSLGPDRSLLYVWVDVGNTGLTGQELATDVVELVCDELGVKYELVNY
jgi:hypothetical protein